MKRYVFLCSLSYSISLSLSLTLPSFSFSYSRLGGVVCLSFPLFLLWRGMCPFFHSVTHSLSFFLSFFLSHSFFFLSLSLPLRLMVISLSGRSGISLFLSLCLCLSLSLSLGYEKLSQIMLNKSLAPVIFFSLSGSSGVDSLVLSLSVSPSLSLIMWNLKVCTVYSRPGFK